MDCVIVAKERAIPHAVLGAVILVLAPVIQALGCVNLFLPGAFLPSAFITLEVPYLHPTAHGEEHEASIGLNRKESFVSGNLIDRVIGHRPKTFFSAQLKYMRHGELPLSFSLC